MTRSDSAHTWLCLGFIPLVEPFVFACQEKYIENFMVHCTYRRNPRAPLRAPAFLYLNKYPQRRHCVQTKANVALLCSVLDF